MTTLIDHSGERYQDFNYDEIYLGTGGAGVTKHVPNVGDKITKRDYGEGFITAIDPDPDNPVPTIRWVLLYGIVSGVDPDSDSIITASSSFQASAITRCYIDDSVDPIVANIDSRWRSHLDASHGKLFLGTDTSELTGVVISAQYNSSGVYTGENVPYVNDDADNPTTKRATAFNIKQSVPAESTVTLVDYSSAGNAIGEQRFLTVNSASMRPASASSVQLTGFTLESVLMDPDDSSKIITPVNTTLDTTTFSITLNYSDGSKVENVSIDGSKAKMSGHKFNTMLTGDPSHITVSYYPAANEPFTGGSPGVKPHFTNVYEINTQVLDTDFVLQLMCVPTYKSLISGFDLEWFLFNLDRDILIDVTSAVTVGDNLRAGADFDGTLYDTTQELSVRLTTDTVLPGVYPKHVHSQLVNITLSVPGTSDDYTPWVIDYQLGGTFLVGPGEYLSCSTFGNGTFNLGLRFDDVDKWLYELFYKAIPLYDSSVEVHAPEPTHVRVTYGSAEKTVAIGDWDQNQEFPAGTATLEEGKTVKLDWYFEVSGDKRWMATTPLFTRLDL